jgi:hypothetical protein
LNNICNQYVPPESAILNTIIKTWTKSETLSKIENQVVRVTMIVDKELNKKHLFTPLQIGIASLFGSILAGFICLVINYHTINKKTAAIYTSVVAIFIVPMYLMVVILNLNAPYVRGIPIGSSILMGLAAHGLQREDIRRFNCKNNYVVWRLITIVLLSLFSVFVVSAVLYAITRM